MARHHIDKHVISFTNKSISQNSNVVYSITAIVLVLVAASYGSFSVNSKADSPDPDTVFYRIRTSIKNMEQAFWQESLVFLRQKRKKLSKVKCYIVVDETYDSYTGRLIVKEKKGVYLSNKEKEALKYIHKYKPKRGDTGSYKYLVFALVYGNKRRVLKVKALKRKEKYKSYIIKTLINIQQAVRYECVLFDRGFYDGSFVENLKKNNIPFILRARISKAMKKVYGFYSIWKCYNDFQIGQDGMGNLVLGSEYTKGKRMKWAFITNLVANDWYDIRKIYSKRWNIENIFKATDGIQLSAQTNNPTLRMFCVCLSFLIYNAWQVKNKKNRMTLGDFVMKLFEMIFEFAVKKWSRLRDKLRINIPLWNRIRSSL